MVNILFICVLSISLALLLKWGFRALPRERWQILAVAPGVKREDGLWDGVNYTYYGLFNANAYTFGVAVMLLLAASIGVPVGEVVVLAVGMLALCMPASRFVAKVVEKKAYTFTVGGASFVGIVSAPFAIGLMNLAARGVSGNWTDLHVPVIPAMAALAIGYSFGEGLGRLACISFGCCYGKPLSESHPVIRGIFGNHSFTFFGKTKKVAYEGGLEGQKVVPIQAVTSTLYICVGLVGVALYLAEFYGTAFLLAVTATQAWRSLSETLRADYRGGGRISAYQIMGVLAIFYAFGVAAVFPAPQEVHADLVMGLNALWTPFVILFLQALWALSFFYTGRSMVTGATLALHVHKDRI